MKLPQKRKKKVPPYELILLEKGGEEEKLGKEEVFSQIANFDDDSFGSSSCTSIKSDTLLDGRTIPKREGKKSFRKDDGVI